MVNCCVEGLEQAICLLLLLQSLVCCYVCEIKNLAFVIIKCEIHSLDNEGLISAIIQIALHIVSNQILTHSVRLDLSRLRFDLSKHDIL